MGKNLLALRKLDHVSTLKKLFTCHKKVYFLKESRFIIKFLNRLYSWLSMTLFGQYWYKVISNKKLKLKFYCLKRFLQDCGISVKSLTKKYQCHSLRKKKLNKINHRYLKNIDCSSFVICPLLAPHLPRHFWPLLFYFCCSH